LLFSSLAYTNALALENIGLTGDCQLDYLFRYALK
jgi:hypothetical protein